MGNGRSTSFDTGLNLKFGSYQKTSHAHMAARRRRCVSSDSLDSAADYGWFEDFESPVIRPALSDDFQQQPIERAMTLPAPVAEVPMYVLESSLETQQLWYKTAGRRPRQPSNEREYFERKRKIFDFYINIMIN